MLLWSVLTLVLTVCADLCFAKGVFSVHNYRHVPVNRNSATVRRVGNVYVFPYYSATRRKIYRCGYGAYRVGCCAGWMRNSVEGTCTPICESGCVHGTCAAPNQCQCDPGYTGSNCNADLNECGLEPRPCNQRCINTMGSFRCHCERGYLLEEDGKTCIRDSRCYPGRCAYGCRKNGYRLECICPAGLRIANDGYHCLDIDECAEGTVTCPTEQRCVNTYGNYMCLCHEGYQFRYINGKLQCTESEDRCAQQGEICDSNARCQEDSGGVAKCECNRGFIGNGQECTAVELKSCTQRPCFTGVRCTTLELSSYDIPYPSDGVLKLYTCGPCPTGYSGSGETCTDIDECFAGIDRCHEHADCINTPGTYTCACKEGYVGNGYMCTAVGCDFPGFLLNGNTVPPPRGAEGTYDDETVITFQCQNGYALQGSSTSTCVRGMWTADMPRCADVNECISGDAGLCHEHATCLNMPGSYRCVCQQGYTGSGFICFSLTCMVLEPLENGRMIPPAPSSSSLEYSEGDFVTFECDDGFLLVGSLGSTCQQGSWTAPFPQCVDVDECASFNDCHLNAQCLNTPGSYRCVCRDGFFGNGQICLEIDPTSCADLPCAAGVVCTDLDRAVVFATTDLANDDIITLYKCGDCPDGYHGDGENCVDVDECAENLYECNVNARCVNLPGTYLCECFADYFGDGRTCVPIDPRICSDLPCFPGTPCTDLVRAEVLGLVDLTTPPEAITLFECENCPMGYLGDGINCTDVNECVLDQHDCHENAECFNMFGTYDCICNRGFFGDGKICIRIHDDTCADRPCFPGVLCTDLSRADTVAQVDLNNPEDIIYQYTCADCPSGYRGDGIQCTDIDECSEGIVDCHPSATCLNIPGSYQCVCQDGFYGDGKNCIRMDLTYCAADGPCFEGVDCTNLSRADVLAKIDLGSATAEDIIRFYLCGDCPGGYLGDGEVCLDIDECDTGDFECHRDASCENEIGGYTCVCVPGHFGNGTHCAQLDDRSCADDPCFAGVECLDVDPSLVDYTQPFVRLFECGECPVDYSGDGFNCTLDYVPPFINLTVVAVDHADPLMDLPAPDTEITAFVADSSAPFGTVRVASAFTGPDGVAVLSVPHNQTLILMASNFLNLLNMKTTKANYKQNNIVTIPLTVYDELNVFLWRRASSNAIGFSGSEGGAEYRVAIPAGGLRVRERRRVQIDFYGVNVTIPESFERAPEPIAAIQQGAGPRGDIGLTQGESGVILAPLEVVGMMELNVIQTDTQQKPRILSPVVLSMPISKLPPDLKVGDSLDAWYFDPDHGVWRQDGTGIIGRDSDTDQLVWTYQARHFTWWAAGRVQAQPSCVRVRTCLDAACNTSAPGVRIRMIGEDYGFLSSRTTDRYGETCFNFKHTGMVTLEGLCTMERVTVDSTLLPAACEGAAADVPAITLPADIETESCREVIMVVPLLTSDLVCPDPGEVDFATKHSGGREYSNSVQYTCDMGNVADPADGYRTCLECGLWSGIPVTCLDDSQSKRRKRRALSKRRDRD